MSTRHRDGFSILGLGAAACAACCAGPLLAFLGGLAIAGTVGTIVIGTAVLLVAAVGAAAFSVLRRRPVRCAPAPVDPVAVASPGKAQFDRR